MSPIKEAVVLTEVEKQIIHNVGSYWMTCPTSLRLSTAGSVTVSEHREYILMI